MGLNLFGSKTKNKNKNYLDGRVKGYVLGDDDTPGWLPEAENLYENSAWSPSMQAGQDSFLSLLGQRYTSPFFGMVTEPGLRSLMGEYDPRLSTVGNVDYNSINYNPIGDQSRVNYGGINPTGAFGSFGSANPLGALSGLLSGRVNTEALDPVADNAMRRMNESFNEQVMPGIRSGAVASGQYGGSRQGVAEGLATKGLNYATSDMLADMYNNAFNMAQQNQYGTANNLAGLGTGLASQDAENMLRAGMFNAGLNQFDASNYLDAQKFNASNDLGAQQYNAGIGFQNNDQQMQLMNQILGNRMQGFGMLNSGMGIQDNIYNQYLQTLMQPTMYGWDQLQNYISATQPGVNYYTKSKGSQTSSPGIIPAALGTMAGIAGIGRGFNLIGGAGGGG